MRSDLNKRCHAVAAQIYGSEAHEQLRAMAQLRGYPSWSHVSESDARAILTEMQSAIGSGNALATLAVPGMSTRSQRDRIAALRHALNWSWGKIRTLVSEYGVDDWRQLTSDQASHLIQRLDKIAAAYKRKGESGLDDQA